MLSLGIIPYFFAERANWFFNIPSVTHQYTEHQTHLITVTIWVIVWGGVGDMLVISKDNTDDGENYKIKVIVAFPSVSQWWIWRSIVLFIFFWLGVHNKTLVSVEVLNLGCILPYWGKTVAICERLYFFSWDDVSGSSCYYFIFHLHDRNYV